MSALLDVILPVFLVIGFGYAAVRAGWLPETAIDGLMRFAQNFAVPCLLFRSIAHLDLSAGPGVDDTGRRTANRGGIQTVRGAGQ